MASATSIKIRERAAIDSIAQSCGLTTTDLTAGIPKPEMRNAIVLERIADALKAKAPTAAARPKRTKPRAKASTTGA